MEISVIKERLYGEKRALLLPPQVAKLTEQHKVYIEKGLGEDLGISDLIYETAGAQISSDLVELSRTTSQ